MATEQQTLDNGLGNSINLNNTVKKVEKNKNEVLGNTSPTASQGGFVLDILGKEGKDMSSKLNGIFGIMISVLAQLSGKPEEFVNHPKLAGFMSQNGEGGQNDLLKKMGVEPDFIKSMARMLSLFNNKTLPDNLLTEDEKLAKLSTESPQTAKTETPTMQIRGGEMEMSPEVPTPSNSTYINKNLALSKMKQIQEKQDVVESMKPQALKMS